MAVITIGGNLGAGKTTLASALAQTLGYEELYVGRIFRDIAEERRLSIEALYDALKNDPDLERSIDERQAQYMQTHDNTVVQGRVAWFCAKRSPFSIINIALLVTPEEGARRMQGREEHQHKTAEEIMAANAFRAQLELERYQKLYAIENYLDPAHYDLVIDTTNLNKETVLKIAREAISKTGPKAGF